ncbi:MAG: hypothetical protein DESF_02289 [Desulfovibrio sp.]
MSVSSVNNYNTAMLQWQKQQLKTTGNSSGSTSNSMSKLFSPEVSMTNQVASMVELTKYAMESMGVSADSRVTFNQITKYREQLLASFNESVKKGFDGTGISNPEDITFTLNADGSLSAASPNATDQKNAQAWLDVNPSLGKELRSALTASGLAENSTVSMKLGDTGKLKIVNTGQAAVQTALDANSDQSVKLRAALVDMGVDLSTPVTLVLDNEGKLVVSGEHEHAEEVNKWLAENTGMAASLSAQLKKQGIDASAASLRLGKTGNVQAIVNNGELADIQAMLDKSSLGATLSKGLDGLGISPDVQFTLQTNANGSVTVISDSPDKAKIQKFFDDNPALVKQYQQIEALSGLDDARKAMQASPTDMRKRIQIESMAAWWSGSGNASSYFGNYSNGNMSVLAGLNLNI